MAKMTVKDFLQEHPNIEKIYVVSQEFYDPFTGRMIHRENGITNNETWQNYYSYITFKDAKIKEITKITRLGYEYYLKVKIPKKQLKKEIKRMFNL
jgi:hypothetical protein